MDKVDKQTLRAIVPKQMRTTITDDLVKILNEVSDDIEIAKEFRLNVVTHTSILKEGAFSFKDYLNAVRYVTYKICGDTNKEAWIKTFPDRYKTYMEKGYKDKDIQSNIATYNKGMLVTKVFEKVLVPVEILYRDWFHDAMSHTRHLMLTAKSELVQQKAAATIISEVKPSETSKVEIDMTVKESVDVVAQYDKALEMAGAKMLEIIKQGGDVKDVANIRLTVKEDVIDVDQETE